MVREATQWEREEMEKVVRDFSCSSLFLAAVLPSLRGPRKMPQLISTQSFMLWGLWAFPPCSAPLSYSAASWLCHPFLCTSLVELSCYLQSSSLLPTGTSWPSCNLENNGLLAGKCHIQSVLSVQPFLTWQSFSEQR